jgi:hypothetical protein
MSCALIADVFWQKAYADCCAAQAVFDERGSCYGAYTFAIASD